MGCLLSRLMVHQQLSFTASPVTSFLTGSPLSLRFYLDGPANTLARAALFCLYSPPRASAATDTPVSCSSLHGMCFRCAVLGKQVCSLGTSSETGLSWHCWGCTVMRTKTCTRAGQSTRADTQTALLACHHCHRVNILCIIDLCTDFRCLACLCIRKLMGVREAPYCQPLVQSAVHAPMQNTAFVRLSEHSITAAVRLSLSCQPSPCNKLKSMHVGILACAHARACVRIRIHTRTHTYTHTRLTVPHSRSHDVWGACDPPRFCMAAAPYFGPPFSPMPGWRASARAAWPDSTMLRTKLNTCLCLLKGSDTTNNSP